MVTNGAETGVRSRRLGPDVGGGRASAAARPTKEGGTAADAAHQAGRGSESRSERMGSREAAERSDVLDAETRPDTRAATPPEDA